MQSLTHIIPQQPYLPQAVSMYNKLKQLKHKQLNKPQRLQQQLNNSNITNRYKDNDRLKPNRDYNKKLKDFKNSAKSFRVCRTIIQQIIEIRD